MANKTSVWLNKKFLQWQQDEGERKTIGDFADFLGVSEAALGHWMNGRRDPTYQNAFLIARKLGDKEILRIMNFDQAAGVLLEFPLPIREALERARERIFTLGISGDSDEAAQIVTEELSKVGYKLISNEDIKGS